MGKKKHALVVYDGDKKISEHQIGDMLEKILYNMGDYFDGSGYDFNKRHSVEDLMEKIHEHKKDLSVDDRVWYCNIEPQDNKDRYIKVEPAGKK